MTAPGSLRSLPSEPRHSPILGVPCFASHGRGPGLNGPWTEAPPECFRELEPEAMALVA